MKELTSIKLSSMGINITRAPAVKVAIYLDKKYVFRLERDTIWRI
jgi:hypothetical protein